MLEIKNLFVSIENKKIIDDLNLTINDGEIHAIMGPNGVGKSTLCKVLLNDLTFEKKGAITYNGIDIIKSDTTDIAKSGIFLLNQNPIEIEGITNAELLRASLNEKIKETINIFEFNKKLENICEKLNLDKSFIHRDINVGMSGGERKKNELLHMWMLTPSFIILDEIDSGLDVDALKIVANSINEYYKEFKPSILIITHHTKILEYIKPDKVHIIKKGTIDKTGNYSLALNIEKYGYNWTNDVSENDNYE